MISGNEQHWKKNCLAGRNVRVSIGPCGSFAIHFFFIFFISTWLPTTDSRTNNIKDNNNIISAVCELLSTLHFNVYRVRPVGQRYATHTHKIMA